MWGTVLFQSLTRRSLLAWLPTSIDTRLRPVGLKIQVRLLQSLDIFRQYEGLETLGSPETIAMIDRETDLQLEVQDIDALISSWHKTSRTRCNALRDSRASPSCSRAISDRS